MNFKQISDFVCTQEGFTFDQINVASRKREIVQTRHIIMYLCKKCTKFSLEYIGDHFISGGDHSNVMYAVDTIQNLIDTDKEWKSKIALYLAYVKGLYIPFIPSLPEIVDLRLIRERIEITATQVRNDLGMSRSHLRTLEKGDIKFVSYIRIKRLLDYYQEIAIKKDVPILTY